jgi:tetratricopeptide (TPR) repeat protein
VNRRWIAAAVTLAVAGGVAAAWVLHQAEPGWTTDSREALTAFEAAETAQSRLYLADARARYLEAHRLDPDFVIPKLKLVWHRDYLDAATRESMLRELRNVDREALTRRERFLLAYHLAALDRQGERADELLADYLDRRPDDPYAVELACNRHWLLGRWDAANDCYQRLIDLDPNRLEAQNRIGYVGMATGDFDTAEQQFEIYRYLAPDQANPYDSLGELMMITGRYREAEAQMRRAIALKPDFCSSWRNLVRIRLLEGDAAGAEAVIGEMSATEGSGVCAENGQQQECELSLWRELLERDWQAAAARTESCPTGHLAFLANTYAGHPEAAQAVTARHLQRIEQAADRPPPVLVALTELQRGITALYQGDAEAAIAHAEEADRRLLYWSLDDQWLLKLLNYRLLLDAHAAAGHAEAAERVRAELAAVNPRVAERPPIPAPAPPAAGRRASLR